MVVSGPQQSENQRQCLCRGWGGIHAKPYICRNQMCGLFYASKYPYSYFLNIEYTLSDNLSIAFYQKGYIFIVTVYILWYSKAKEMNA